MQTSSAWGHQERVFDVQFSPACARSAHVLCCSAHVLLATASEDQTLRCWFSESGGPFRQVLCCYGHEAEVLRCAWSPDGHFVASGSADRTVRVYRAPDLSDASTSTSQKGVVVAVLAGLPEEVYHLQFLSPKAMPAARHTLEALGAPGTLEGHMLVASSESLFLWELSTSLLLGQFDAPGTSGSTIPPEAAMEHGHIHSYIYACAFHPEEGHPLLACACNDGFLRFWSLHTVRGPAGSDTKLQYRSCKKLTAGGGLASLVSTTFDSEGQRLAVATKGGQLLLLDVSELQRAYAGTSAPPSEPRIFLVAFFQAPSRVLCISNFPASSSGSHTSSEQPTQGHQDAEQRQPTHAHNAEQQQNERRGSAHDRGDRLLVAAGGEVHVYGWGDPAGTTTHTLSHTLQQQHRIPPTLYTVTASSDGIIAAAGEPSRYRLQSTDRQADAVPLSRGLQQTTAAATAPASPATAISSEPAPAAASAAAAAAVAGAGVGPRRRRNRSLPLQQQQQQQQPTHQVVQAQQQLLLQGQSGSSSAVPGAAAPHQGGTLWPSGMGADQHQADAGGEHPGIAPAFPPPHPVQLQRRAPELESEECAQPPSTGIAEAEGSHVQGVGDQLMHFSLEPGQEQGGQQKEGGLELQAGHASSDAAAQEAALFGDIGDLLRIGARSSSGLEDDQQAPQALLRAPVLIWYPERGAS